MRREMNFKLFAVNGLKKYPGSAGWTRWTLALLLVAACVLAAVPARAGIYYQAVTTEEGGKTQTRVKAWVEGAKAKVELEEAGPGLQDGSYLLTTDGGRTLYLVNPKEKTYSRWDLDAMFQTFNQVMESMGPMMNMSIDNPEVEKVGEEAGGTVVGLPTTRYRYRSSYELNLKVMGMKRSSRVQMDQEIWATQAVSAPGLGVWLRPDRPTGFEGLDELLEAEMGKLEGFPLKVVTETTTTNKKGKSRTTRSTMEVTTLEQDRDLEDGTFEIPEGYTEEAMPTMGENGEDEGGNPFGKLFGGGKGD